MDWNRVEGNWKQVKGAVKQQWGKLTDDDLTQIDGSREKLEGIIQERYGIARDETRKQIDAWYQQPRLEISAAGHLRARGGRLLILFGMLPGLRTSSQPSRQAAGPGNSQGIRKCQQP